MNNPDFILDAPAGALAYQLLWRWDNVQWDPADNHRVRLLPNRNQPLDRLHAFARWFTSVVPGWFQVETFRQGVEFGYAEGFTTRDPAWDTPATVTRATGNHWVLTTDRGYSVLAARELFVRTPRLNEPVYVTWLTCPREWPGEARSRRALAVEFDPRSALAFSPYLPPWLNMRSLRDRASIFSSSDDRFVTRLDWFREYGAPLRAERPANLRRSAEAVTWSDHWLSSPLLPLDYDPFRQNALSLRGSLVYFTNTLRGVHLYLPRGVQPEEVYLDLAIHGLGNFKAVELLTIDDEFDRWGIMADYLGLTE